MIKNAHIIILDRARAAQINETHEIVKAHANGWWHQLRNIWIVGSSLSAPEWRDLLKPAISSGPGNILVMDLPADEAPRKWAYVGRKSKERCEWLHKNYK